LANAKKILLLGSFAPSLINFRGSLISAMLDYGHSVVAAAPSMDQHTADALRKLGAEPRELAIDNASLNPRSLVRSVRAARTLLRSERPDVILAYTIKPVIVAATACRSEGIGRMVALITGAGYAFTSGREIKRLVSRVAASALYWFAFRRTDAVIFQNPDDERLFRKLRLLPVDVPSKVVNGSGVDLAHFSPAPLPRGASFLMIARLLKDKGIREFAAASKRLKSIHPNIRVTLVGDLDPSPDSLTRTELDGLVRSGIDYRGHLDDVRSAIADCGVYVLPSYYREGTPRSILEAMAMGRAIITTDSPGCRETVIDGENGFLVRPRDADHLFATMMRFVNASELAAKMGRASRELAERKYDVREVNADVLRFAGLA
jgi:glycosyltransferase involved in cell wall biosynthesis